MAYIILPSRRIRQPQHHVGIDWGNALARGLVFCASPLSRHADIVKGVGFTFNGNQTTGVGPLGRSFYSPGTAAQSISFPAPFTLAGYGSIVLVQQRLSTGSNEWLEIGKAGVADHFPYSGSVYTDALMSGTSSRWMNGVSIPSGKSFTAPHVIGMSVNATTGAGSQIATWDGVPWYSNTAVLTGTDTLPSTWYLNGTSGGGFEGHLYAAFIWDRPLSYAELFALGINPWQLFQKEQRRIYVPAAGGGTIAQGAGSSAGAATASAVGASLRTAAGSSAGAATAAATGASLRAAVGSSAGVGSAAATGRALVPSVGSSAGAATAAATGTSSTGSLGASAGTSTAAAVGASLRAAAGSSTGAATAAATGASLRAASGSSAGVATVAGVGSSVVGGQSVGSSAGASTAAAAGAGLFKAAGLAEGIAICSGVGAFAAVGSAVGTAAGTSTASAVSGNAVYGALSDRRKIRQQERFYAQRRQPTSSGGGRGYN